MKDWFGLVARLVTGGVWIVAGALKLPYPADSVRAVRAYDLLPEAVVPAVGHLLPVVEVVIGLCLVLGVMVRGMSVVSALLFVAFIIGISSAWARGLSIDCGCFGGGGEIPDAAAKYPGEIARDVGLLALSLWLVVRPRSRLALETVLFPRTTDTDPTTEDEGSLDGAEEDLAQDR
ncbi:MAG TPA: MauE/DoxX family redox-associated membrane protein [Nocardioides sp.]|nr:MauE/DoxX family redox-associated membrane protein [Nocardioides sp.]